MDQELAAAVAKIDNERRMGLHLWWYPIRHAGQMTKCQIDDLKDWLTNTFGYKGFDGGVWGRHIIAFIYMTMLGE